MSSPHVYDKAEYHAETVEDYDLPDEHAANHTVVFLRWLIERRLMSELFEKEATKILAWFRAGKASIHQVYASWDYALVDDMLSEEGNEFARHYFDFERGAYLGDYVGTLQGRLPSEFHVEYTEANYQKIRPVIDSRYDEWRRARLK